MMIQKDHYPEHHDPIQEYNESFFVQVLGPFIYFEKEIRHHHFVINISSFHSKCENKYANKKSVAQKSYQVLRKL